MPIRTLVLLLALSLLGVRPASAQNATLNCTVVDGSNALVPGASAVLRNVATGVTTESVSNGQGLVSFPSARPGLYELTISLEGFAPITVTGLRLEVGESRAVTARLEPSDVRETVTVTAAATPLANDRADRGVVVENKFVQSIPLNIRNPLQMINNAVGVTPATADSGNNNVSQSRTNTFRINGAKGSTTDIQLDGATNITA